MRRYARVRNSNGCIVPGKAISWVMLSLTIITIISLFILEVRRIVRKRSFYEHQLFPVSDKSNSDGMAELNIPSQMSYTTPISETWNTLVLNALLEDEPACLEKPFLLILVTSSPENFDRREAIRKTWANVEKWRYPVQGVTLKTVFLVGQSSKSFINVLLENERDSSRDILTGEYIDTYRNLTIKVMHGLRWAAQDCHPDFVLKTDDDCFVNVPILLEFLLQFNPEPLNIYAGRVNWSARVVRDPTSPWYVSRQQYPRPKYAPYANGAGYILSRDVLEQFVLISENVPVFPNEDAYVGTVLYIAGIEPTYSDRFVTQPGPWQVCNYLYLFVIHKVKAKQQTEHQAMANEAAERCPRYKNTDWV